MTTERTRGRVSDVQRIGTREHCDRVRAGYERVCVLRPLPAPVGPGPLRAAALCYEVQQSLRESPPDSIFAGAVKRRPRTWLPMPCAWWYEVHE